MTLAGTRPILQDELQKYELHHRARIAIKPGITGMWQVSGRSDITDLEVPLTDVISPLQKCGPNLQALSKTINGMRLGTFQLSDIFYNTVGGMLGGLMYCGTMKARKCL